ncbi:MAG: helix-turn-helix domain-containing protein [Candidatus Woesearchaeota archaeon]|nr:MAG: helix-turn-helix domain-containing protein [Candidatus Woesearchaeota archaeon]
METLFLEDLGITSKESAIYLVLLKSGKSLAGAISQKSGIHRRTVYDALERLIEKGLVTYIIEDNKKYFLPTDPNRLVNFLKEKEQNIQSILPTLSALYASKEEKEKAEVYRGKAAMMSLLDQHIQDKKTIHILASMSGATNVLKYYWPGYSKAKAKAGVVTKVIYVDKMRSKIPNVNKLTKVRYLPKGYDSDLTIVTWGNKVALQLWHPDNPLAVLIRSERAAKGFMFLFNLMWGIAKE